MLKSKIFLKFRLFSFTNKLKNGEKVYYSCERQSQCLKRIYITNIYNSKQEYDIFLCDIHHLHKETKWLSIQLKRKAESILNLNNGQIITQLNNLLTPKQLYNLKYRFKKKLKQNV